MNQDGVGKRGEAAKPFLGRSKEMMVKHAPLDVDFKLGPSGKRACKANRWVSNRALLGKLAGGKFAEKPCQAKSEIMMQQSDQNQRQQKVPGRAGGNAGEAGRGERQVS